MRVKAVKGDVSYEIELDNDGQIATALEALSKYLSPLEAPAPKAAPPAPMPEPVSTGSKPEPRASKKSGGEKAQKRRATAAAAPAAAPAPVTGPQVSAVYAAMQSLGRPVTPQEILAEMRSNPEIEYMAKPGNPVHGVKQILRQDEQFLELPDGTYAFAGDNGAEAA